MFNRKRIKHLECHIESLTKTVNELSRQSSPTTIAKLVANEYVKHKRLEPFLQLRPMADVWVNRCFVVSYLSYAHQQLTDEYQKFSFISLDESNEIVTVCNEKCGVYTFHINYVLTSNPKGGDAN